MSIVVKLRNVVPMKSNDFTVTQFQLTQTLPPCDSCTQTLFYLSALHCRLATEADSEDNGDVGGGELHRVC